jgi:hypothetical protein
MTINFKSKILQYNNRGVGLIYLPKEHQNKFKVGQQLEIIIELPNNKIIFFAKLRKTHKECIYIPSLVATNNNNNNNKLLNKAAKIRIEETRGFFTKIGSDGRIYIPSKQAQELQLKQDEIILVEGIMNNKEYNEICLIKTRNKLRTTEYHCTFNYKLAKKEGTFNIKSVLSRKPKVISKEIKDLIKEFNYAQLNQNQIIMYCGNRIPVIINTNLNLKPFAHYLGCYFADGTKRGNSWGICSSTFQQANYFLIMHNTLIHNPPLNYELTYTDPLNENKNKLKNYLCSCWLKQTNIEIPKEKVWIYKTETKNAQNRNKFGSMSTREHRQLTLIYYNRLLTQLINKIVKSKNKALAIEFLCGVLEGDGATSASSRGHVVIATNKEESKQLLKVFRVAEFKHQGYSEGENKYYLRIGSLELIRNMSLIKDKIFKYYPKRRKILQERLANTGGARFLLNNTKTSNALIGKLKTMGILDQNKDLTVYGKEVKKSLKRFIDK